MSASSDLSGLIDPICHAQVDSASQHHCVHGGALFFFCSEECRARFAADASRWAVAAALGGIKSAAPVIERGVDLDLGAARVPEKVPFAGPSGQFKASSWMKDTAPPEVDIGVSHAAAAVLPPDEHAASGGHAASEDHGLLSPLAAWRERHFAAVCCRELLKLYHTVAAQRPDLARADLYRQIVVERTDSDNTAADTILRLAEESFASWPVSRELNFRDVVHYLAVSEFLDSHKGSRWVHADMRRIVHSVIPHDL
jgi:YHS domain-containing protein